MEYSITGIAELGRDLAHDADGLGLEPLQVQRQRAMATAAFMCGFRQRAAAARSVPLAMKNGLRKPGLP